MKEIIKITGFTFILGCMFISTMVLYDKLYNNDAIIKINMVYLFSYKWETEDPFEKIKIDTVRVLDIKKGYVKFAYVNRDSTFINDSTYYYSLAIDGFSGCIKPFKLNKTN